MNLLKNRPLVSAILVNWNGEKWLKKCLTTLAKQTYQNLEIIVVDNGSTDTSVEFIKKNFPKVKILQLPKNSGFPKANEKGIEISKGKYLLLINNDTWVEKDFVERLYDFYTANNYAVISPREKRYEASKRFRFNTTIDITGSPASFGYSYRKDKLFFTSVCYFCSKEKYRQTLGFDTDYFAYYEDVDWFWRMSLLKENFDYADNIFIYHAGAGAIGKGIKYQMFLWRNQNALQTLLKNYSTPSLLIILPIYFLQNLIEIFSLLLLGKGSIAYSYIQGWLYNIKFFRRTLKKRKWVQNHRKISDWEIFKKMYWGPAKLFLLVNSFNK